MNMKESEFNEKSKTIIFSVSECFSANANPITIFARQNDDFYQLHFQCDYLQAIFSFARVSCHVFITLYDTSVNCIYVYITFFEK